MSIEYDILERKWVRTENKLIKSAKRKPIDWEGVCQSLIDEIKTTGSIERLCYILRDPEAEISYDLKCIIASLLLNEIKRKRGRKRITPQIPNPLLQDGLKRRIKYEKEMLRREGALDCSEEAAIKRICELDNDGSTPRQIDEILYPRKKNYCRKT